MYPNIVKRDGSSVPFEKKRLRDSLQRSGTKKETVDVVLEDISNSIKEGDTTDYIYQRAFSLLSEMEKGSAMRYSLRNSIFSYGPTGFPFEQFIGRLFEKSGYAVTYNQHIEGHCAPHEVDVLAKGKKILAIEVKFHSRIGIRVDMKTVLYVHARFQDLVAKKGFFSKKQRSTIDQGVLITNSKFTSRAIQYAECASVEVLGWGYPRGKGLEKLIETTGTHPITCLPSLRPKITQRLFDSGIVVCKELIRTPHEKLAKIVGNGELADRLLEEAKMICV